MKRISKRLLSLLLVAAMLCGLMITTALADDETVTIGTGTSSYTVPYGEDMKYASVEMLYNANEINHQAGNITSIAFNVTTASECVRDVTIYMGNINKDYFAIRTEAITSTSGVEKVYSNSSLSLGKEQGWETVELDTPFAYDGTSSLLIIVCSTYETAINSSLKYACTVVGDSSSRRVLCGWSNSSTACASFTTVSTWTVQQYRPNIQLTFGADTGNPSPASHTVSFTGGNAAVKVDGETVTSVEVTETETLSFTVEPDSGYEVTSVTANGTALTPAGGVYKLENVSSDVTVTVTTAAKQTPAPSGETTQVEIGSQKSSIATYPYAVGSASSSASSCELIYTASDIQQAASTISALAFYVETNTKTWQSGSVKIYMGNTDKTSFSTTSDWVGLSDLTLVYSGTPTLGSITGWEELELDTAFDYSGGNLLVAVSTTGGDRPSALNLKYAYTATSDSSKRTLYSTSSSAFTGTGYSTANLPDIRLTFNSDNKQTGPLVIFSAGNAAVKVDGQAVTGSTTVTSGSSLSFTVEPDAGYEVTSVKAGGQTLTPNSSGVYTLANVTSNTIVTIETAKLQYTVTFVKDGASVTMQGTEVESTTVDYGGNVAFTVTAAAGRELDTVTASNGASMGDGYGGFYQLKNVTENITVTVTHKQATANHTVSFTGANVTVVRNGQTVTDPVMVVEGGTYRFQVEADAGYMVTSVKANDVELTADGTGYYTVTMGTADVTVVITAEKEVVQHTYKVTFTGDHATVKADNKDITSTGVTVNDYGKGGTLEFTVTPDTGYEVTSATASHGLLLPGNNGAYTLTDITANTVVTIITAVDKSGIEKGEARLKAMTIGDGVTVTLSTDGHDEWGYETATGRLISTNYKVDNSRSDTTITIHSVSPFTISFEYAVDGEQHLYYTEPADYLVIELDGTSISASEKIGDTLELDDEGNYILYTVPYTSGTIQAGEHTLTLSYRKDGSVSGPVDRAYVSNIVIKPASQHTVSFTGEHASALVNGSAVQSYIVGSNGSVTFKPTASMFYEVSGVTATGGTLTDNHDGTWTLSGINGDVTVTITAESTDEAYQGSGTKADPYLLNNADDMYKLARQVNAGERFEGIYFKLTADVTLNDWTPIGGSARPAEITNRFAGHFNGDFHTVTISLNDPDHDFNGLFGAIDCVETSKNRDATVENVIVAGSITGGSFTAGVVGHAAGSAIIRFCGNEADITGGNNHTFIQNQGPNDAFTGGIVGYVSAGNPASGDDLAASVMIVGCYNTGSITNNGDTNTAATGKSQYTGGIAGQLYEGSIQFCYNTGAVHSTGLETYIYTGGIAGMSQNSSLMNSYNAGTVTAASSSAHVGAILGSGNMYYQQDAFSYYLEGIPGTGIDEDDDKWGDNENYILAVTEAELKAVPSGLGSNFEVNTDGGYPLLKWQNDHTAVIEYLTEIYTVQDLRLFVNNVRAGHDYDGEIVKLMADIDLEGDKDGNNIWTPIGTMFGGEFKNLFAGTFDGQGHTISNMVMANDSSGAKGLFSVLPKGATVMNLTVDGIINTIGDSGESSCVGSIAGWNLGTVENCTSNVEITAWYYYSVGGIVGDNAGAVIGCTNNGTVDGKGYYSDRVGGIAGRCEPYYVYDAQNVRTAGTTPVVEDCVNNGGVNGGEYVGGIVGGAWNEVGACVSLSGCANHGEVVGYSYIGGIIGYMSASSDNYDPIEITNCYNTGDIYSQGNLEVYKPYTGGIVGQAVLGELTISNCYNSGAISGPDAADEYGGYYAGAIAGRSKAVIVNTYYQLGGVTEDIVSVGDDTGENHTRPVSEQYRKETLAEKLGGAYSSGANGPVLTSEK